MKKPIATSQGRSRFTVAVGWISLEADIEDRVDGKSAAALGLRERGIDHGLRFGEQRAQVRLVAKALRIDLVDVLGAGGARGEPAVLRGDLETADRRIVSRRLGEHLLDRVAGQGGRADLGPVELGELFLLRRT